MGGRGLLVKIFLVMSSLAIIALFALAVINIIENSERKEVEKLLSELDRNRKEESHQVQSQIKSIKGMIIGLSILILGGVGGAEHSPFRTMGH